MRTLSAIILGLGLSAIAGTASAKVVAPAGFCETYNNSPFCTSGPAPCAVCHSNTSPPAWNSYGDAVKAALSGQNISEAQFLTELPEALASVEGLDSDGDDFDNLDEILGGSRPGDSMSTPGDLDCPDDVSELDYPICVYSPRHVFRKVYLDFCGHSPSYDDMQAFVALDAAAQLDALHATLESCVDTEEWLGKNGAVWRLAHPKIRPVGSLKAGEDAYSTIRLADYYNDYNLYVWSQIDDNDARSVITADFFVQRSVDLTDPDEPKTSYATVADIPAGPPCGNGCTEPMQLERRNGNITSRWFLDYFVMFTPLPRNAAAQAYRAYLGYDIARVEGLFPVTGEPKDYDNKGVKDEACAQCHSTLDPLTYAYRNYNGLTGGMTQGGDPIGRAMYVDNRLEELWGDDPSMPELSNTPENGQVLGQDYADLNEWTQIAANHDQFAKAAVNDYWKLLVGTDSESDAEFDNLWKDLKGKHAYSIEKMLHDLIMTEAYGAP